MCQRHIGDEEGDREALLTGVLENTNRHSIIINKATIFTVEREVSVAFYITYFLLTFFLQLFNPWLCLLFYSSLLQEPLVSS